MFLDHFRENLATRNIPFYGIILYFSVSVGKDGVGYNFSNGSRASVGGNILTYKFNNGAEVYGKPTAGGKLH